MDAKLMSRALSYAEETMAHEPLCVLLTIAHLSKEVSLDIKALRFAVKATCTRHPNLRSRIVFNEQVTKGKAYFEPLKLDFQLEETMSRICQWVKASDEEEWERIAATEVHVGYKILGGHPTSPAPYWKVILVRSPSKDVLMVKHHRAVADARSGSIIINDILQFHQECKKPATKMDPASHPALPRITTWSFHSPCTPGNQDTFEMTEKSKISCKRQRCFENQTNLVYSAHYSMQSCSTMFCDGTQENLAALMSKCKREGIGVKSVLLASSYFAAAKIQCQMKGSTEDLEDFGFMMHNKHSVTLRPYLCDDSTLQDNLVGSYETSLEINGKQMALGYTTPFWDFARKLDKAILRQGEEKNFLVQFGMNQALREMRDKIGPVKNQAWGTLSKRQQLAALVLGYNEKTWGGNKRTSIENKRWIDLTSNQQAAAKFLGSNDGLWDGRTVVNDIYLCYDRFSTTPGENTVEKVYHANGSFFPECCVCSLHVSSVMAMHFSLSCESNSANQAAANHFLTHFVHLVENSATFDREYDLRSYLFDPLVQNIRQNNSPGTRWCRKTQHDPCESNGIDCREQDSINAAFLRWDDLSSDARCAAQILGYNESLWDDDEKMQSDLLHWNQLDAREKQASKLLGFEMDKWDSFNRHV